MSFVDGFYSFHLEITDPDRNVFHTHRVKLPRHPQESDHFLLSRILAYCHSYRHDQQFSRGLFEPRDPAIFLHDVTGKPLLWADVGCPEAKKLKRALKSAPDIECRVYFFSDDQILRFCHYLRGSKSNWIDSVQFFKFSHNLLNEMATLLDLRMTLAVTIVDTVLYLDFQGRQFEENLPPLNMWDHFQSSLDTLPEIPL